MEIEWFAGVVQMEIEWFAGGVMEMTTGVIKGDVVNESCTFNFKSKFIIK